MAEQKHKGEITVMDIAFQKFCQSLDTEELKMLAMKIEKHLKPIEVDNCSTCGWAENYSPYFPFTCKSNGVVMRGTKTHCDWWKRGDTK